MDTRNSNTGRLTKCEMAKETEGQRRQEVQDRQLVKGRGGRFWNDKKERHEFLSMYSTHKNLRKGNEERKKEGAGQVQG